MYTRPGATWWAGWWHCPPWSAFLSMPSSSSWKPKDPWSRYWNCGHWEGCWCFAQVAHGKGPREEACATFLLWEGKWGWGWPFPRMPCSSCWQSGGPEESQHSSHGDHPMFSLPWDIAPPCSVQYIDPSTVSSNLAPLDGRRLLQCGLQRSQADWFGL